MDKWVLFGLFSVTSVKEIMGFSALAAGTDCAIRAIKS